MYRSARQVRDALRIVGVKTGKVTEADDQCDGDVEITDAIHVQVGYDYVCVVKKLDNDTFQFFDNRDKLDDLVNDIKRAQG